MIMLCRSTFFFGKRINSYINMLCFKKKKNAIYKEWLNSAFSCWKDDPCNVNCFNIVDSIRGGG